MKKIIFLLLLLPVAAAAQTGYFAVGSSSIIKNYIVNPSFGFSAGAKQGQFSAGAGIDCYLRNQRFAIAFADLRAYLKKSPASPFLSLQPGYVLYGKTIDGIETKGAFAGSAMIGYEWRPGHEKPGFMILAGYQYYSFTVLKTTARTSAFKASLLFTL